MVNFRSLHSLTSLKRIETLVVVVLVVVFAVRGAKRSLEGHFTSSCWVLGGIEGGKEALVWALHPNDARVEYVYFLKLEKSLLTTKLVSDII